MSARRQTNTFSGGLNILNKNNISKACNCSGVYMIKNTLKESRLKRSLSCKGIINTRSIKWKDYAACDVRPARIKISEYIKSIRKPVVKYSLNGEYIEEYSSISDAARKNNVVRSGIRDCCNGRQLSAYGFLWKLKNNNYECITTS